MSGRSAFPRTWVDEQLDHAIASVRAEADGVDVLFRGAEGSHVRLAESVITQASRVVEGRVTVRVVAGGRQARAATGDLSRAGIAACARRALDRARVAPAPKTAVELPGPEALPSAPSRALDPATAWLDAGTKAAWLDDALRAHQADDLALAGRFHTGLDTLAVRSSTGVGTYHQGSWANLSLCALERPAGHRASSYRARLDARVTQADVQAMQESVRAECHRAHDPVAIEPGRWDVVLAPAAVTELLEWLGHIAFSSRAADDGMSFAQARRGEQVTGEAISIVDDGSMPFETGVPIPFDIEGQPKQRVVLVEDGVARGVVHDTESGRRYGCASTGHAQLDPSFPSNGSRAGHLHILPGTATPEELVGRVERGLLVTRLHYVNGLIDPPRAVMTGLLRDAAFLIEGGKTTRAVQTLRFTESLLDALARVPGPAGISRDVEAHALWFGAEQCAVAPWVLVPGLAFTSGR